MMKRSKIKRLDILLGNVGDMALKRRARRIVEELDLQKGDRILDAGCGDGFYLHLLSNLGLKLKLVGVDCDPKALTKSGINLKGKEVRLVRADLMGRLPFKDNYFDKVIMSEVLEHLSDDAKGLEEIHRILKPGGILCLSVPNSDYPFLWDPVNWILEHLFNTHIKSGFWAGIWHDHLRLYSTSQLKRLLKKSKFKIAKIETLTWWCLPFNHYIFNIAARLLHSKLPSYRLISSMNKFNLLPKTREDNLLQHACFVVKFFDRLNDYFPRRTGVGIFVKVIDKIYEEY